MIKNTDKFREAAIAFQRTGKYTNSPPKTTFYRSFWDEEIRRCIDGYTALDGDYITGYHYFYLNYCPILLVVDKEVKLEDGSVRTIGVRERDFPRFWDGDYEYFNAIELAERTGQHLCVLKTRRRGYSYKGASMLCRNYYLIPESKSYAIAAENEFLIKDGILSKAWEIMSFIDENTAWAKKRQKIDTRMHKRASLVVDKDGVKTEIGYLSEIIGVTVKNDVQKIRGKAAKLMLFEESGKFPNLLSAWNIARSSMEQGGLVYGLMIAFGCVCAGTKIWTNNGDLINIEDLVQSDGVVGYNTYSAVQQNIEHFREPYYTDCYRITTNSGKIIECSHDHPIVFSKATMSKRVPGKRKTNEHIKYWKWKNASEFEKGDQIGVIDEVPIFGKNEMWNPRLIGWLIGDGSYGIDKTPRLSNCEEEINEYIEENFDTVLEKSHITKDNKKYKETRLKNICFRLRELGIYGQVKSTKRLPKIIFNCKKEDVCELIGGLFDTDGYVTDFNKSKRHIISITSAHKELLIEISFLLQKIGVHGKLCFIKPNLKNGKDKNGHYRHTISDIKSLKAFANNIRLFPKEKQSRLNLYKEVLNDKHGETSKYIHGLRFEKVISAEYIGSQKVYNIAASDTHTYVANGFVTHNTGGTESADYEGLKELFYNPKGYNVLPFKNIWDEGANKECGFFVPEYMNMDGYMDKDGNSFVNEAKKYAIQQRQLVEEHANDKAAVDRYVAEKPFTPIEATLQISTNIFPKVDLIRHLNHIVTNSKLYNYRQVGDLIWTESGKVKWELDNSLKDITKFPLQKGDNKKGSIVIWEHPPDDIPYGLYVAGCDPYDHDTSTTDSLGSIFIYKRFQDFESYYDIIVAEYTGRPETADEFYEKCRLLSIYYRATILYENQNKGLFQYFTTKHCEYLLADQPSIIDDIIKDSTVQRRKGIHMNTAIKEWAERECRDWLNEEYEDGKKNLTKILSVPLLQELISYNDKGNFDRVIALFMIMIYKKELHKVHVKNKRKENRLDKFFTTPLFSNYDNYELYLD